MKSISCAILLALASAVSADSEYYAANLTALDMTTMQGNFSMEISDDNTLTYSINGVTATSAGLYVTPMLNNVTGGPLLLNLTNTSNPQSGSTSKPSVMPSSMLQSTFQSLAQQIEVDNYSDDDDDTSSNTISGDDLQDLLEDGIIYVEVNTSMATLTGLIYELNDNGTPKIGDSFQEPMTGAPAPSNDNTNDKDSDNSGSGTSSNYDSDNDSDNDNNDTSNSNSSSDSDNGDSGDDGDSSNDSSDNDSDDGSK